MNLILLESLTLSESDVRPDEPLNVSSLQIFLMYSICFCLWECFHFQLCFHPFQYICWISIVLVSTMNDEIDLLCFEKVSTFYFEIDLRSQHRAMYIFVPGAASPRYIFVPRATSPRYNIVPRATSPGAGNEDRFQNRKWILSRNTEGRFQNVVLGSTMFILCVILMN